MRALQVPAQKGDKEQALGYSRGGFGTKVHVVVDSLGNPLRFSLTPGQAHEAPQAQALLAGYKSKFVLGDKAYDAKVILKTVTDRGAEAVIEAVIPPRKNRREPRDYDRERYKERHLVACLIGKLKRYRHVFSRFDKLARNYCSFLHFAAALIWLR